MHADSSRFDLSLARKALFSVDDAAGVTVTCNRGSDWLTLDNDPRDVVLEPGESFTASGHRRAVIYALEDSCIRVREAQPAPVAQLVRKAARRPAFFSWPAAQF